MDPLAQRQFVLPHPCDKNVAKVGHGAKRASQQVSKPASQEVNACMGWTLPRAQANLVMYRRSQNRVWYLHTRALE